MSRRFHVSSVANRASILAFGWDPSRMGAAPGIAGSRRAEVEGCFLAEDEWEAQYFVEMNNTGGAVDVWAVDDIDAALLLDNGSGYFYVLGTIPRESLTLLHRDLRTLG